MADSNITKRALANALKELMNELPFEKINVAQICEKCDMNRKSFYYHFKDKYDLVNWIFDIEFISTLTNETFDMTTQSYEERFKAFDILIETFYLNRNFYKKAFEIKGQNSFSDHFRECMYPVLKQKIEFFTNISYDDSFAVELFSDFIICALVRWLSEKECMPPAQFSTLLKNLIEASAVYISNEIKTDI